MFVRSVSTSQRGKGSAYVAGLKDYGYSREDVKDGSLRRRESQRKSINYNDKVKIYGPPKRIINRIPKDHIYLSLVEIHGTRVRILIRGKPFETYEKTLDFFPETLLGNHLFRQHYFDVNTKAFRFDNQCFECFNSILFYYQSKGILRKPFHIKRYHFLEELQFFKISKYIDKRHRDETQFLKKITKEDDLELNNNNFREILSKLLQFKSVTLYEKLFYILYLIILIISIVIVCLDVESTILSKNLWYITETVINGIFTVEYVLHIYASYPRKMYLLSNIGLLDLFSIIPFYSDIILYTLNASNKLHSVLHFARTFRIFKFVKLNNGLFLLLITLSESIAHLLLLFISVGITSLLFASVVFNVENNYDGDGDETMFSSVFEALWYAVITATGVGYGDVYPLTILGKFCGGMLAVFGVLLFCLPATMLVSKFIECYYLPDALSDNIDEERKKIVETMRESFLQN